MTCTAEYHLPFTIKRLERTKPVIIYNYDQDFNITATAALVPCKGGWYPSKLLLRRAILDLPIVLEEAARRDFERRCEVARDERSERHAA